MFKIILIIMRFIVYTYLILTSNNHTIFSNIVLVDRVEGVYTQDGFLPVEGYFQFHGVEQRK